DHAPAKDLHLPPLCRVGDLIAPLAPQEIAAAGLDDGTLTSLALRLGYTVSRLTTDWLCKQLHPSMALAQDVVEKLCYDGFAERLWRRGQPGGHEKITEQGREDAARQMEVCGYIGPGRVGLEASGAMLRWKFAKTPPVQPEHVVA